MPTFYSTSRKIRGIQKRLQTISGIRRKKIKELRDDYDRKLKMMPKYLWISSPPLNKLIQIKAQGTYCRKKHGALK